MVSFSSLRRRVSKIRDRAKYKRSVVDKGDYFLVRLPRDMSNQRTEYISTISKKLSSREIPIVLDFGYVTKFDTSGCAALCALVMEYPGRLYGHRLNGIVDRQMEVAQLEFLWKRGITRVDSLEQVASQSNNYLTLASPLG